MTTLTPEQGRSTIRRSRTAPAIHVTNNCDTEKPSAFLEATRSGYFSSSLPSCTGAEALATTGPMSDSSGVSRINISADEVAKEQNFSDELKVPDKEVKTTEGCPKLHNGGTQQPPEIVFLSATSSIQSLKEGEQINFQQSAAPSQVFRDESTAVGCPSCRMNVSTNITHRVNSSNWALSALLCAFGFHFGCCLIPFFVNSLKDIDHTCPRCGYVLGQFHRV